MNKIIKNIGFEYRFIYYSKFFLALIGVIFFVNLVLLFIDHEYVSSTYSSYMSTKQYYEENGLDIQADLESGSYEVTFNEDGTVGVENPILYYQDEMSKALFATSPKYAISHILELGILIFPLLFGSVGALLATNDFKYKLYRHKILRFGRENYYLTKLIALFSMIAGLLILFALISQLANMGLYQYITSNVPVDQFETGYVELKNNLFLQLGTMFLISAVYASISFLLGIITKNSAISIIILTVYLYIVPFFSKYEIKNCCYNMMNEIFDFYGIVNINVYEQIDFTMSIIIVLGTIVLTNLMSYIIIKKRSAYN